MARRYLDLYDRLLEEAPMTEAWWWWEPGRGPTPRRGADLAAGVEVVAVVDPVRAPPARWPTCGAAAYSSVEEALDAGRADAAYVCVPPFAHGDPERAVLARGLPMFVEKPVGADLAVARGARRAGGRGRGRHRHGLPLALPRHASTRRGSGSAAAPPCSPRATGSTSARPSAGGPTPTAPAARSSSS